MAGVFLRRYVLWQRRRCEGRRAGPAKLVQELHPIGEEDGRRAADGVDDAEVMVGSVTWSGGGGGAARDVHWDEEEFFGEAASNGG